MEHSSFVGFERLNWKKEDRSQIFEYCIVSKNIVCYVTLIKWHCGGIVFSKVDAMPCWATLATCFLFALNKKSFFIRKKMAISSYYILHKLCVYNCRYYFPLAFVLQLVVHIGQSTKQYSDETGFFICPNAGLEALYLTGPLFREKRKIPATDFLTIGLARVILAYPLKIFNNYFGTGQSTIFGEKVSNCRVQKHGIINNTVCSE